MIKTYNKYVTNLKHYLKFVTNGAPEIITHNASMIRVMDKTRFYEFIFDTMQFTISPPHGFCDKNYKTGLVSSSFTLEDVSSLNRFKEYFRNTVKPYRMRQDEHQTKYVLNRDGEYEAYDVNGVKWQRPLDDTHSHTTVVFRGFYGNGHKPLKGEINDVYNLDSLYRPYHGFIFKYLYRKFLPRLFNFTIDDEKFYKFKAQCVNIVAKDKYKNKFVTPYPFLLNTDLNLYRDVVRCIDVDCIRVRNDKTTNKMKREYLKRGIRKILKMKKIRTF